MALSAAEQQRRQQLRRDMRRRRQALSPAEQLAASNRLAHNLCNLLVIRRARRIGVYLASDGELDPLPALLTSDNPPRTLYLPVLPRHADAVLHFAPWAPGEALVANRFAIGEPTLKRKSLAPLWSLDVLLMPLVAFDRAGNRLGMGGGFYDRALANLIRQPKRPHLIGVAHAFQKVNALPAAPWDQPLDRVITD
ncbi:MAG: 5-formyltetrahydrofolate cyclo-ligase [Alcanivoracaceae bacterium]|jgi:5-formyltetrahydrofolate cyclo-ligase|nr:5-formyltetrahydrofolate cyclo-ligase [Alcanivoracaceae bacterium]